jgi:hypothetical protein
MAPAMSESSSITLPHHRWLRGLILLVAVYGLFAYVLMPAWWKWRERSNPAAAADPTLTSTATGIPGDPLNLSIIGSQEGVVRSMIAAGWRPADPLTFRTSVQIAVDTVFDRPDEKAPVSSLYLFGRKEDLAFEKPAGSSPKERHHVRFWRTAREDGGHPVWIGSASYDTGVELSHTTGAVTHHISPEVDKERDTVVADLTAARRVAELRWVDGFHRTLDGRNGGGDPWRTDGRLAVVVLAPSPAALPNDPPPQGAAPQRPDSGSR